MFIDAIVRLHSSSLAYNYTAFNSEHSIGFASVSKTSFLVLDPDLRETVMETSIVPD